ncbi:MAG: hypothetical protein NVSMB24_34310 [Mucilaginibacter sp.]
MKTAEKNANGVQGTAANNNQTGNRIENRPSVTQKEAKEDDKAPNQKPAETPQGEADKEAAAKTGGAAPMDNKSGNTEQPAKQEVKGELKEAVKYIKPALNLEQTLKSVDGLHRLSIQRLALIGRIKTLEDFEVTLIEENDELEANPYQGCRMIIKDDKGREFVTNTPNLIRMVSPFIFDACHEKLADIEAKIIFPSA